MKIKPGILMLVLMLLAARIEAPAQSELLKRTLVVNGQSGPVEIYRVGGKSFINLETLVRIANATVSLQGDQIILTFPAASTSATPPAQTAPPDNSALSNAFMRDGVQFLGTIKNWTDTLSYAIQRGVPGDGSRLVAFRERSAEALRLAKVEANSESDRNALQLLDDLFQTVQSWNDRLVSERRAMNTGQYSMGTNALENDETYQKIRNCSKFLGSMIPSGQFQDDGSCR